MAAARGYAVCVNYCHDAVAANGVVEGIVAEGGRALAVRADVADERDVLALFEHVDGTLGVPRALVNNAGVLESQKRVEDMDAARIARVLAVNVIGGFLCAREAVRRMSTRTGGKGGSIVNVSSYGAITGSPGAFIDYAASKGALDTMTIGLAAETAGSGIRVNAVRPGLIDTAIHNDLGIPDRVKRFGPSMPIGRAGTADEVAEAIVWLLSDKASYVTGDFINVTGGAR
jgi:NAD(P)-dependent dehydrogenase (short-subunit alcohol dehydrogenase family)